MTDPILCLCGCGEAVPQEAIDRAQRDGSPMPRYANKTHRDRMRQRRYRAKKGAS